MRRLVSAYGLYVYPAVLDFRGGLRLAVTPDAGTEEESAGFLLFLHVVLIFSEQKLQRRHRRGRREDYSLRLLLLQSKYLRKAMLLFQITLNCEENYQVVF